MAVLDAPRLLSADPAEISDFLLAAGLTNVRTNRDGGEEWLNVVADQGDVAILAALATFEPTSAANRATGTTTYAGRVPPELAAHVEHVRGFVIRQRTGVQRTRPAGERLEELEHMCADLALAIRELVRRDLLG